MRTIYQLALLSLVSLLFSLSATAQSSRKLSSGEAIPDGMVVYSLPSTTLHISAEALRESYTPGPYSKYAKKYLGFDASSESKDSYKLLSLKLTPYLEADRTSRYVSSSMSPLFKFSTQGLIVLSDQEKGNSNFWRFPTLVDDQDANLDGLTQNLTSTNTTLYKNVRNDQGGYDKVAVQQSQVVEKSIEKKAQETADMIFNLRKKRVEIITGDTDATYSGEAMKAAIDEIARLEESYMSLFIGTTTSAIQKMDFDVVPNVDAQRQIYVAFRLSDNNGLLMGNNLSGRPIYLELTPEEGESEEVIEVEAKSKKSSSSKGNIYYRVPQICVVKILDGQDLLLQSRVPVYQLGETLSLPIN